MAVNEAKDIQVYTGSQWKTLKDQQVYDGSSWRKFGVGSGVSNGSDWYVMGDGSGSEPPVTEIKTNKIKLFRMSWYDSSSSSWKIMYRVASERPLETTLVIYYKVKIHMTETEQEFGLRLSKGEYFADYKTSEPWPQSKLFVSGVITPLDKDSKYQYVLDNQKDIFI